ncbi:MAG: hypothetical protein RI990_1132 [Planctomycetota bacterium]
MDAHESPSSVAPALPGRLRIEAERIWTGDDAYPWATSIEIEDARVVAVDRSADHGARVVRLPPGATVLPGLIDGHLHLTLGALGLAQLDLSGVRSRDEFERAIAGAAAALAPGRWLRAHGWHEANWGGERPTRDWLRAAGAVPCVAYRMDHHACVVNDAVLSMIDGHPCPEGGEIVRDAAGRPTGLLLEQAAWRLVNPLVPVPPAEDRRRAVRMACRHAHRFGLTAVGSMEYGVDLAEVYVPMRAVGGTDGAGDGLTLRVAATVLDRDWPVDLAPGLAIAGDDRLRIAGWKSFIDGTLGSRTARMLDPYSDDAGNRGMLVEMAAHSVGRLREWAARVIAAGRSPAVHVIGDEALRLALDAIEPVDPERTARFEHCQTVHAADVARFAGRIASMQPLHKADDARIARARLGDGRMDRFFRFRDLARAGARLSFGSDWPIVTCDPRPGIRAAVTGLDLDGHPCETGQNLTVEETLRAYTRGAAEALGLSESGALRLGGHADLCILANDPFHHDWAGAPLPEVLATVAGGRVVHGTIATPEARVALTP